MKNREFLKEIKELSVAELRERARGTAEELMKLRFRRASGQLEQSHRILQARRNLARLRTLLVLKSREGN